MKNILITGISKGLGLEIATCLLKNNYKIFAINRTNTEEVELLSNEYTNSLQIFNYDLANTEKISKLLLGEFIDLKTPIDGFINNAAYAYDDIITNINFNELEKMYKVNVFSPFVLTKYVIRNMLLNKVRGSIIHISSISVHTGYKGLAMYASTKGALESFSKNTAREWGEKGIRSNCIVAGFMETNMSNKLKDEQKERIYRRTALKKATTKKSVANMAEFLLSDRSESVTGQNLFVDSGTI